MRTRWPILAAFLAIAASYVAYPYVTLFRLGEAIRSGDAATLQKLVDWPAVREGIKEDICDLVLDAPSKEPQAAATLPPFGSSFVRGIASSSIDRAVTPEALVAAGTTSRNQTISGADVHVNWAFFDDPTAFSVSLSAPGQTEPIRLQMELRHGEWRVKRVWLPAELLQGNDKA
jgi:hypothetical protein